MISRPFYRNNHSEARDLDQKGFHLILDNVEKKKGSQTFFYNCFINSPITGIYGPSGSGKTTLINLLAGTEKPDKGRIVFGNQKLFDHQSGTFIKDYKRNTGLVFQSGNLFPHLTVEKNLRYGQRYNQKKNIKINFNKVTELLDLLPLRNKKPRQLSGGEKQKVAIGRALLTQPSLLLLDEPFSNLDHSRKKHIISYLLKVNTSFNIPMLIISHDLKDLLMLTNELLIIEQGHISHQGDYWALIKKDTINCLPSTNECINTAELYYSGKTTAGELAILTPYCNNNIQFYINSNLFHKKLKFGQKIKIAIQPKDIALSRFQNKQISIRNQVKGRINKIIMNIAFNLIEIDCGIILTAEISKEAIIHLDIREGMEIFVLIKTKSIEVIHLFDHETTIKEEKNIIKIC